MTRPSDSSIARERVKLWFFRDMTDAQRIELLKLFGLSADEMGTHAAQTHGLRHVFDALSAAEFDAESPTGVHTIPEKVSTTKEPVYFSAQPTHIRCQKCPAHMPVGLHCGGAKCPLRKP